MKEKKKYLKKKKKKKHAKNRSGICTNQILHMPRKLKIYF